MSVTVAAVTLLIRVHSFLRADRMSKVVSKWLFMSRFQVNVRLRVGITLSPRVTCITSNINSYTLSRDLASNQLSSSVTLEGDHGKK